MDVNMFKGIVISKGYNISQLALKLGMTPNTLYTRLQGRTTFTLVEMIAIKEELKLSPDQVLSIFPELVKEPEND